MASAPNILWDKPPGSISLSPGEVHIWCFPLEHAAADIEVLSPREKKRAAAFVFDIHRERYIAAHTALRQILSNYARVEPAKLLFEETPRGKPSLENAIGESPLHFNLSHSESLGLCAVTREAEIGVDVEFIHPLADMIEVAERFFAAAETHKLRLLPPEEKELAFFNCWTRKEACLKATGDGIADFLAQTEVTLSPSEECRLLKMLGSEQEACHWKMEPLRPAIGYAGAMAIRICEPHCRCWQWLL